MSCLAILLTLAAPAAQNPSPARAAVLEAVARRPARDSAIVRAWRVIDSLVAVPAPRSLTATRRKTWSEQTTWLKSLNARIENLLTLVVAPAKEGAPPAPIDARNLEALQKEAELESQRLTFTSNALKARHDVAMNAIRNMR